MKRPFTALWSASVFLLSTLCPLPSLAGGPPPRDLATPEARRLTGVDASEYWDLNIELEQGYRVFARFLITNEGPGKQNGTAVGHVISPSGKTTQFRNGRLESGWELSRDGLDLDIGKSHLDLHAGMYQLKVNKSDAMIRFHFAPNALFTVPKTVTGKNYRVDLLALGAATSGTIQVKGMATPVSLRGRTTATHTVSKTAETDVNIRRTEFVFQPLEMAAQNESALYISSFLSPRGNRTRWLAVLKPDCDHAFAAAPANPATKSPAGAGKTAAKAPKSQCVRKIEARSGFDLVPGHAKNPPSSKIGSKSYWIPPKFSLQETLQGKGVEGEIKLGERILRHMPLDDLPGPIRFIAGLRTKPRRIWSTAEFDVRLPPSLDTNQSQFKPNQFQGQGVATVSFLNPVPRP